VLWANYDIGGAQWQFQERAPIFAGFSWALGIDGIALMLIVLSVFLMPICILASQAIDKRVGEYMAAFLFMEALMIGVFAAQDLFLFYIFFEAGLIPMYLIIGVWGGKDRIYAAYKFFLYTLLGSVLMLIAMLWMVNEAGTTDIPTLMAYDFPAQAQTWLWLAFFASFAVKMPMWPVHTWLPDAHVQAPTAGSVILAGVLLKMGGYGFIRFSLPMFPEASAQLMWLVFALSMLAVVLTSLIALVQHDMKKLIAYSSVAHMAIVTVGLFAFNVQGFEGAMIVMLAHGLVSGALFLCVGVIYDRPAHARDRPLRRALDQHAQVRAVLHAVHDGLDRASGHQRVRRRVPQPRGNLQGLELGDRGLRDRRDPWRGVHALPLLAHRLRSAEECRCGGDARPVRARVADARPDRRRGAVDGGLSRKLPCADARRHRCAQCPGGARGSGGRRAPQARRSQASRS
jgi:proton-translocating NADH-quinone oxidoreductase chain M